MFNVIWKWSWEAKADCYLISHIDLQTLFLVFYQKESFPKYLLRKWSYNAKVINHLYRCKINVYHNSMHSITNFMRFNIV